MLHYLPNSAWDDGNLAEAGGRLGKMVEQVNQTQVREQMTPCIEIDRLLTFGSTANLVLAVLTVPVAVASSPHLDAPWQSDGAEELGPAVVWIYHFYVVLSTNLAPFLTELSFMPLCAKILYRRLLV